MNTWAYVFITARQPKKVLRQIRQIPGVIHADALFGSPDLIAIVEGADIASMDAIIDSIARGSRRRWHRLEGSPMDRRCRAPASRLQRPVVGGSFPVSAGGSRSEPHRRPPAMLALPNRQPNPGMQRTRYARR